MSQASMSLMDPALVRPAIWAAFAKLSPRTQARNPVMFVVYVGSALCTLLFFQALGGKGEAPAGFILGIALWLWFTVLFANFAEALAEGRSKAQAAALRGLKKATIGKRLRQPHHGASWLPVESVDLRRGDVLLVEAGDMIPMDGEVIEGVASVDESAITGESAPVIRESGGDFSAVTGGTRVLSDWLVMRVSVNPGEAFLDRMIAMVEGAKRHKTPNEIALTILLVTLTLVFLLACVTLLPFSMYSVATAKAGAPVSMTVLIALLVCLIPTTIGALLSAIGVAGMSRMMQANVIATSGRAVEAAGDVDVLLLDKTGTITLGNRQASLFVPAEGVSEAELAEAAWLASQADETPEGRSIVVLARQRLGDKATLDVGASRVGGTHPHPNPPLEGEGVAEGLEPSPSRGGQGGDGVQGNATSHHPAVTPVPFTAQTRMSGVNLEQADGTRILRKGAASAIKIHVQALGGDLSDAVSNAVDDVARRGSTPLVVADGARVLGVVELKDIVKPGMRERFAQLRSMGIKTVMITGDNRLTAAAIAAEAGVDDFLAEATPEAKLRLIREYQDQGRLVAMTGDGTNDAPALAQADVAVAMNTGTQAAKEAGNMVDLDSDPTKLIEVVETGKQLLMTRGALTTFSIANDVAKYFAIIPAAFASTYPQLATLDIMHLTTPSSAILSAVIFNALVIIFLIPLALKGVKYRPQPAAVLLRRNLLIYGVGGLIVPFIGIKLIDIVLTVLHLA
jgi:K+-transporting ATPase ATPase B chain